MELTRGDPPSALPRRAAKAAARGVAEIVVLPCWLWHWALSRLIPHRRDQVLQGVSQLLALVPGTVGSFLRVAFYTRVFWRCGAGTHIGFGTIFATADISIGERVYIGSFCNIGHADIGSDVLIGSNVTILSGKLQHRYDRSDIPINRQGGEYSRVAIGDDSWLGNASIVMVPVPARAVVAAGSVVNKPFSVGDVIAGNPARVIANRLAPHEPRP